jgi:hypothetical protein
MQKATEVETKFLRLRKPVALGDRVAGWRVCWLGGWDKCRVFYVVMVERYDTVGPNDGDAPAAGMIRHRLPISVASGRAFLGMSPRIRPAWNDRRHFYASADYAATWNGE